LARKRGTEAIADEFDLHKLDRDKLLSRKNIHDL
jgi:hypothetical protein